jgi:hypothetical protein
MKVEIGADAALFPEKQYISGIFVAVSETKIISIKFFLFSKTNESSTMPALKVEVFGYTTKLFL